MIFSDVDQQSSRDACQRDQKKVRGVSKAKTTGRKSEKQKRSGKKGSKKGRQEKEVYNWRIKQKNHKGSWRNQGELQVLGSDLHDET